MKPKDIGEYHLPHFLRSTLGATLTVGLAYALVAKVSYETTTLPGHIAPIFPSAGIALPAMIILGRSGLFGVWLGSISYNLILLYQGSGSPYGRVVDLVVVVLVGLGAMSGAGTGGWLVQYFCKGEYPLQSARNVTWLVTVGALGGCLVSATVGVAILSLAGTIPVAQAGYAWLTWWAGDAAGTIILAPLILSWLHQQPSCSPAQRAWEAMALGGLTLLLCYFSFFLKLHLPFFLIPLLLWGVFRFGVRGASSLAATIAIFATVGTSRGGGPFIIGTVNASLLYLCSFLAVIVTSALVLAGLLDERKRGEAELSKYRDHLEELIAARTAELVQARNAAEAALQKLNKLEKLRDDLVHMVVHDLRSPLAGLELFFDLLSPEEVAAPDFKENLNLMRETSRALSEMVTSLLDVNRLESGQMPLHCQTGDLGHLINVALKRLSGLTQGRKISVPAPAPPVLAYCDPVITERIVQNLLGNALKFTPTDGWIRIELVAERSWARLSITDTGPGIPMEYHEKVFEKFGQVEMQKSRKLPSSGIGLTFCKLAAEAQGGSIQLESAPGQGSTFHVRLPQPAPEGKKK